MKDLHDWYQVGVGPRSFHTQWKCRKCDNQITWSKSCPPYPDLLLGRTCSQIAMDVVEEVHDL